ncbi:TonB-dependent receptor plug domain-containing protein [Dyella silvatica]|uniref:TonB-dependent receptor plug domain-containing protein n=1 Tax=Dyella silvatica TaxID=2992128 RepID=UPI00224FE1A4|nr:TonB-dependent receptor [Dyella silvatica]
MKQHPPPRASRLLHSVLWLALFATPLAHAGNADIASAQSDSTTDKTKTLEQVTVTGSRSPRVDIEGPSPVITISSKDLDAKGFRSVFDALNSLTQNTGMAQGEDFGNTFTPAANTINLRGLGPNHTLVLINGRRVADYPVAYDGSVNFVNLSNIPSAMIDRIEILNGGASAIYGSDAIAGVVNIILKQKASGLDVNLRVGSTEGGGGSNQRLQIVGGHHWDKLDAVYGIEVTHREPIWGTDRSFMDSLTRDPSGKPSQPTAVFYRRNMDSGKYVDPGNAACAAVGGLYDNSVSRANNPRYGYYCGSDRAAPTFWTVQTEQRNVNAYTSLHYHLSEDTELFGDALFGVDKISNTTRAPSWTSLAAGNSYFLNANSGNTERWYRRFSPEEIGGRTQAGSRFFERSWNATLGIRGSIGDGWKYEAAYNRSEYDNVTTRRAFLAGLDEYFLGPQLGTQNGVPVYAPDAARLYQPLTAGAWNQLTDTYASHNSAWVQTLSLSVNHGDLFELPGGSAGFAGVLEAGSQGYRNTPDARLAQGVFWNNSGSLPSSGKRDRYAVGAELSLPVLSQVIATLAGRYDSYSYAGRNDNKATWSAGLEYRPLDSLLLRGNVATSFRAPDMNYIFASATNGYIPGLTDYYRCRVAGQAFGNCDFNNQSINYTSYGSTKLKAENARSFSYGLVWSPNTQLDVSVDYYKIRINNEVTNLSADGVLRDEADCRLGQTQGGQPIDITSAQCQSTLARVQRNPAGGIDPLTATRIFVNPINAASERTSGIDASGNYRWNTAGYGDFALRVNYSLVLTHDYQQFPGGVVLNVRDGAGESDSGSTFQWRSKLNGSLSWHYHDVTTTLFGTRYGSLPNADQSGRIAPYFRYNASVAYRINDRTSISLVVNNLLDKAPPKDRTGSGWPFYPVGNYDPYGRQWWIEANYHFGS